ncbi:hypothetical protein SUS17_2123 [Sphingomonas sp. S17]|nr:hypothetical protein SUS17_2123 [Sphingomonas sp. S17]
MTARHMSALMARVLCLFLIAFASIPAAAQVDPAARGIAAQARLLALGRKANVETDLGDSRVAANTLDPSQRNRGTRSPMNWVNAMLGQRLTIGQTFGVSGDRTDQMFARLPAAIATNAGILRIWGGINNIGAVASGSPAYTYTHAVTGETVTINTVAAVTMRDLRQMAETARAAGMIVIIENEIGGSTITTTEKLAALNSLRQMIAEYGEVTPGIYVHDAFPMVMQPGAATPTFKAGYSYDGIHYSGRGAYWHAKSEAPLVDRLTAPRSVLIRSAMEVPANGRRQLLTNPIFATTTGGTAGNGITGDVPSGWTAAMGTNVGSTTLSSVTNSDAVGNGVQAAITYNAAGSFSMTQTLSGTSGGAYNANLQPGDEVEGFALVEITGASSALSTISLELTGSTAGSGGTAFGAMDLTGPNSSSDQGVNDTALITLRTRPVVLPSPTGTFPYLIAAVRATAFTSGSATIVVRQIGVRRRGS